MWVEIDKDERDKLFSKMNRSSAVLFSPLGHAKVSNELLHILNMPREQILLELTSSVDEIVENSLYWDLIYSYLRSEIEVGDKFRRLTVPVEKDNLIQQVMGLKCLFSSVKPYFEDDELIFFSVADSLPELGIVSRRAFLDSTIDPIHDKLLDLYLTYVNSSIHDSSSNCSARDLSNEISVPRDERSLDLLRKIDSHAALNNKMMNSNLKELEKLEDDIKYRYYLYKDEIVQNAETDSLKINGNKIKINEAFSKYRLMLMHEIYIGEKFFLDNFKFNAPLFENLALLVVFKNVGDERQNNMNWQEIPAEFYILNCI